MAALHVLLPKTAMLMSTFTPPSLLGTGESKLTPLIRVIPVEQQDAECLAAGHRASRHD
jgi:hypothetical protein